MKRTCFRTRVSLVNHSCDLWCSCVQASFTVCSTLKKWQSRVNKFIAEKHTTFLPELGIYQVCFKHVYTRSINTSMSTTKMMSETYRSRHLDYVYTSNKHIQLLLTTAGLQSESSLSVSHSSKFRLCIGSFPGLRTAFVGRAWEQGYRLCVV